MGRADTVPGGFGSGVFVATSHLEPRVPSFCTTDMKRRSREKERPHFPLRIEPPSFT
jgi:hypothetical protein